jgi:hypothetical protein
MRLLTYAGLAPGRLQPQFDKFRAAIERDDLRSIDMKKLAHAPYYRAKLDVASRVLVRFVRYREEVICLALEIIENHAYEKSRFLRGASVDESKIEDAQPQEVTARAEAVRYLHPERSVFQMLDKVLSFDDAQEAVESAPLPLVLIGSAGSGKTALALHRLRQATGPVLYVTQSAWLARNARDIYFAHGWDDAAQEAEFLSFREFLETLRVPDGREVRFADFAAWFARHRQNYRFTDAHACFEEFRGVIGSAPEGVLGRDAYLALGARQSIFGADEREPAFSLFLKYRDWLREAGLYDVNLLAHKWMDLAQPRYDMIVIDEVQDLTNAQLALILRTLGATGRFLLCGDSNQVVHPNFFSWASVKQLFWRDPALAERQRLSVLHASYRNARTVVRVANDLLKIKQARFGSIDRESNYLVEPVAQEPGEVRLLRASDTAAAELDAAARVSTQVAVIVLRDEDKAEARTRFRTPLLFSVHEAKGLEYPTVILWNLVSGERRSYAALCEGVAPQDLQGDSPQYRRAKDREDRSLELHKFFVNALYVALTRAVARIVWAESDIGHPLFVLLGLGENTTTERFEAPKASREDWEREALRLEQQGKLEQAQSIRDDVLRVAPVPWPVWDEAWLGATRTKALDRAQLSQKPREALLDFAIWHGQHRYIGELAALGWSAVNAVSEVNNALLRFNAEVSLRARHVAPFEKRNLKEVLAICDRHGVDHRTSVGQTPLAMAALAGNVALVDALLARGADPAQRDCFGWTPAMAALDRATRDPKFASHTFADVFERLAAPAIDVESGGRLVRLLPRHGEYLVFLLMLVGYKRLSSLDVDDGKNLYLRSGFCADGLLRAAGNLPDRVLSPERRKRAYFNQVLARAAVGATYLPRRELWTRTRTGYYLPSPVLGVREERPGGGSEWRPIHDALRVPLVLQGTGFGVVGGIMKAYSDAPRPHSG